MVYVIKLVLYEPCPGPNFAGSVLLYDSGSLVYSCLTHIEANLKSVERVAAALAFAAISPKRAKCTTKNGSPTLTLKRASWHVIATKSNSLGNIP